MFEQAFKGIALVLWKEAGLHHGAGHRTGAPTPLPEIPGQPGTRKRNVCMPGWKEYTFLPSTLWAAPDPIYRYCRCCAPEISQ